MLRNHFQYKNDKITPKYLQSYSHFHSFRNFFFMNVLQINNDLDKVHYRWEYLSLITNNIISKIYLQTF